MVVSENSGTQQPWVFLLKLIILGCFGGTIIFGNTHIWFYEALTPSQLPTTGTRPGRWIGKPSFSEAARITVACNQPTRTKRSELRLGISQEWILPTFFSDKKRLAFVVVEATNPFETYANVQNWIISPGVKIFHIFELPPAGEKVGISWGAV